MLPSARLSLSHCHSNLCSRRPRSSQGSTIAPTAFGTPSSSLSSSSSADAATLSRRPCSRRRHARARRVHRLEESAAWLGEGGGFRSASQTGQLARFQAPSRSTEMMASAFDGLRAVRTIPVGGFSHHREPIGSQGLPGRRRDPSFVTHRDHSVSPRSVLTGVIVGRLAVRREHVSRVVWSPSRNCGRSGSA